MNSVFLKQVCEYNKYMRLLLTGATGFLGAAIEKRLVNDANHRLMLAVRRAASKSLLNTKSVLVGDLSANTDWSSALSDIDVVIHTAARVHVMNDKAGDPLEEFRKVNFEGTMALAHQAVQAGVKRFIFISSIKVNGEETLPGKPFTAADMPNSEDPYGVSKAETEEALLQLAASTGLEVVIIRPPLVYGPGVKANFYSMIKWVDKGVPLPFGAVNNKRSLVALDNLVSFIVCCISHPKAANEIFLISDREDVSTTELLKKVAKSLEKKSLLIPVPVSLMTLFSRLLGKGNVANRLFSSLQVDSSKAYELLGWSPVISMDEQLKKTAVAYLNEKIV